MALPYSVRVTNNGSCLEFMPIASGGNYVTSVPDAANGAAASGSLAVSPHSIDFGTARYLSIGAMASTELYANAPVSLAVLSSRTATSLSFPSRSWQRNSVNQRFYLLDAPQAFCIVGTELRFYQNQSLSAVAGSEVDLSSSYSLMAASVTASSPFSLSSAAENRNTNVIFNINFVSNGQSVAFNQSVMIRNVP
jgi:MSHA biogenesis protein MshO